MAGGQEPVPASTQSHTRLLLGQPDLFSLSNGVCLCGVCLCSNCVWMSRFRVCSVSLCNERYVFMWVSGVYLQCNLPGNPVQRDVLCFPELKRGVSTKKQ